MASIEVGMTGQATLWVEDRHSAQFWGSGSLPVFATPAMVALMEAAAVNAIEVGLTAEETSVGTALQVTHSAATPLGVQVRANAEVVRVEGRQVDFKVSAYDSAGLIGEGTHQRVVVNSARFMQKVEAKKHETVHPRPK